MSLPTLEEIITAVGLAHPDGSPMQQLTDALIVSGQLTDLADELTGHFVQRARDSGATWAEIGECIGVSKQAAQKRYKEHAPRGDRGSFFLTRLADDARTVVRQALARAREQGSDHVGTEHIVLALTDDPDCQASRAIEATGVTMEEVQARLRPMAGEGPPRRRAHIPFSPASKKVLELSLREAIRMGSRRITTGHILLAIIREARSPGALALHDLGIDRRTVERWLEEH